MYSISTMLWFIIWLLGQGFLASASLSDVCDRLIPEGFTGIVSDNLIPFIVEPLASYYYPGKAVTVEIHKKVKSDARELTGFVLQARSIDTLEPVGDFFSFDSNAVSGYDCGKESRLRPDVYGRTTLVWGASDQPVPLPYTLSWMSHYSNGSVQFVGSVILADSMYWTQPLSTQNLDAADVSHVYDCAGRYDCGDLVCQDTEEKCPDRCGGGKYKCPSSGRCVEQWNVCDDVLHCGLVSSKEDEYTNMCRDCLGYQCQSSNLCLRDSQVCDGIQHCPHSDDELFKGPNKCCRSGFLCDGGTRCLDKAWICDKFSDCDDHSDEYGCGYVAEGCASYEKRCVDGKCVGKYYLCAGETCDLQTHISCDDDSVCLPIGLQCDGLHHCTDGSDEGPSACNRVCIGKEAFVCPDNSKCLHVRQRCDGKTDCQDKMDEDYYTCYHYSRACDGFSCRGTKQCVPMSLRCDGVGDCNDHSDEANCNCEFSCDHGTRCFSDLRKCDTVEDCDDGTDESDCSSSSERARKIGWAVGVVVPLVIVLAVIIVVHEVRKRRRKRALEGSHQGVSMEATVAGSGEPSAAAINQTRLPDNQTANTASGDSTAGTYTDRRSPGIHRGSNSPRHSTQPSAPPPQSVAPPSYSDALHATSLEPPPPSYDSLPVHLKEDGGSDCSEHGLLSGPRNGQKYHQATMRL